MGKQRNNQDEEKQRPPSFDEVLDATDGGWDILVALIDGLTPSRRNGLLNPSYDDKKPSLSVFKDTDRWRWRDFGNDTGGDAIDLYKAINPGQSLDQLLWALSMQFMGGRPSNRQTEQEIREELNRRKREREQEARQRMEAQLKPQRIHLDKSILREMDGKHIVRDWLKLKYGEDASIACALYGVIGKGDKVGYPIFDPDGNLNSVKWIQYRTTDDGRLTKKDTSGKPIGIYSQFPEGLDREERRRHFFGLPMLSKPHELIAVVEAEDTAVMAQASGLFPSVVFLATGGKNPSAPMLNALIGRKVQIIPDVDAVQTMRRRAVEWQEMGIQAKVADVLGNVGREELSRLIGAEAARKADLKDFLTAIS